MEEGTRLADLIVDYDLLGEKPVMDLPENGLFIPRSKEDLYNKTPIDYLDPYLIKPKRYENIKSLENINYYNDTLVSRENYIDLSSIDDSKLLHFKDYPPKSELIGRTIGQLVIQDLILKPKSNYNSSLPISLFNSQKSLIDFELGATKPEDLPEMALPILEFMDDVQPHIVIGCDRGGRLFGLAMHAAWRETRGGQAFPTLDGKLHFARVSKSEDPDVLQEKIDEIVDASKQFGKQRGNQLGDDEQLRVLFVDDWVIRGGTMRLAQRLMEKHGAQTYFAVMCGEGADATGAQDLKTRVSWHDRPEEIGVNYLSTFHENSDGTVTQKQEVLAVRGEEAIRNRQRIQQAAKELVRVRVLAEVA